MYNQNFEIPNHESNDRNLKKQILNKNFLQVIGN